MRRPSSTSPDHRRSSISSISAWVADGHTASLVPGDPVLDVTDADVALTGVYQGRRRMTLTYPALNRARRVLWLVTGEDKAAMLVRLRRGDPAIPAGRVRQDHAVVLADRAAAQQLEAVARPTSDGVSGRALWRGC